MKKGANLLSSSTPPRPEISSSLQFVLYSIPVNISALHIPFKKNLVSCCFSLELPHNQPKIYSSEALTFLNECSSHKNAKYFILTANILIGVWPGNCTNNLI